MIEQFRTPQGYIVGETLCTTNGNHNITVLIDEDGNKVNYNLDIYFRNRVIPYSIPTGIVFANSMDECLIAKDHVNDLSAHFCTYGSGVACSLECKEDSVLLVLNNPYLLHETHQIGTLIKVANLLLDLCREYINYGVIDNSKYSRILNLINMCLYSSGWGEISNDFLDRAIEKFCVDYVAKIFPLNQPINYLFEEIKIDGIYSIIEFSESSIIFNPKVNIPILCI